MRIRFVIEWMIAVFYLLTRRTLDRVYLCKCFREMLIGGFVYHLTDLSGIKVIVTQRDRYPIELAILQKAKELGVKTIRIEDFPSMGSVNRDTILCDYYFCPNSINNEIFRSFKQNDKVVFVNGGFPYWDIFARYQYAPSRHPKIISYWTQYGTESGIFGKHGPSFYIEEILSVMNEDFVLYVKVHPLDNTAAYEKYASDRVIIVPHGTMSNISLMTISTHIFSINSFSSFEAKHITGNAYFVNYHPEEVTDFSYGLITDYIDLIQSRKELLDVMNGTRKPKEQHRFIEYFNPSYPHTGEKLSAFIQQVARN